MRLSKFLFTDLPYEIERARLKELEKIAEIN
jgi:hypothetical protein